MNIGLFGGSFNPIHNGHIAIGRCMLETLHLDKVWFLVSPQNPFKRGASDLMNEQERLRLVQLSVKKYDGLEASDYEFHLPKPSYTWNTLQSLRNDFPQHKFTLIIGGDNWAQFNNWSHHDEILTNYDIAVFPREGSTINEANLPPTVHIVHVPLINISSTMLREMLQRGEDIAQYVPFEPSEITFWK